MRSPPGSRRLSLVLTAAACALLSVACANGSPGAGGERADPDETPSAGAQCASPHSPAPRETETSGPAELRRVDEELSDRLLAEFRSPHYETLRSALVLVDGRTVFEEYFHGGRGDYHHVWSVTKSVMSTLVGIALDEGALQSIDQTLAELLPAHAATMSPEVASVTVEQLLTMTGGFLTDWPSGPVYLNDGAVAAILAQQYATPGDFEYSDAGAHLLSAILAEATGMSVLEYARERLFEPLGIASRPAAEPVIEDLESSGDADFAWGVDAQGINVGGLGLRLRARDLAKIGLLYLQDGTWNGRRIVPAEWVRAATTPQVVAVGPEWNGNCYGYEWWVPKTRDGSPPSYRALGYGGQFLVVVPSSELVIVYQTEVLAGDPGEVYGPLSATLDEIIIPTYAP